MTPKSLQSRLKIAKNAKFGSTEYSLSGKSFPVVDGISASQSALWLTSWLKC
ncbi:hypothetical protein KFU94_23820 [Chloroflexi bacterium TSY]|nr:hypothetical protein [Chloroflexi bacterium TSY]